MKRIEILAVVFVLATGMLFLGACKESEEESNILIDQTVTVPGGGGGVDVTFSGSSGMGIHITLICTNVSLQPYGYLQAPNGSGAYIPPLETASGGQNSADTTLDQNGTYTLTIFEGENIGGAVHVTIEEI